MPSKQSAAPVVASPAEVGRLARAAYVFGYPLVLMDATAATLSAVARPTGGRAPKNQLAHMRSFPDASFTDVVSPNADTLYSTAVFDLEPEPIVVGVPDSAGRYYLLPILDAWTNVFASPGARTTGTGVHEFALVGPHWDGEVPPELERIDSPTNLAWMIGRTQTNGLADYHAVHRFQDGLRVAPLSARGVGYTPPVVPVSDDAPPESPVDRVNALAAGAFFTRLADLMVANPPAVADEDALHRFAAIGLAPGEPFSTDELDDEQRAALERAPAQVRAALAGTIAQPHPETLVNGWTYFTGLGRYGTAYGLRALIALVGLGANTAADALYPSTGVDADGEPLHGAYAYRLHFPAGELPPVHAFWSLTLYDDRRLFIPNPIGRHAIGDRDALEPNEDGSVDILIQHEPPALRSNWLPAGVDAFNLIMRMYWPRPEALDGSWQPPAVERCR